MQSYHPACLSSIRYDSTGEESKDLSRQARNKKVGKKNHIISKAL
jgi:hypothetical protein